MERELTTLGYWWYFPKMGKATFVFPTPTNAESSCTRKYAYWDDGQTAWLLLLVSAKQLFLRPWICCLTSLRFGFLTYAIEMLLSGWPQDTRMLCSPWAMPLKYWHTVISHGIITNTSLSLSRNKVGVCLENGNLRVTCRSRLVGSVYCISLKSPLKVITSWMA